MLDERPRQVRRAIGYIFFILILLGALPASGTAQTVTGTLQGTVTDTTGSQLPGVSVSIQNIETGATRQATTNERGQYLAPFLPARPLQSVGVAQRVRGSRPRGGRHAQFDDGRGLPARSGDHAGDDRHGRASADQHDQSAGPAVAQLRADPRQADAPEPEQQQYVSVPGRDVRRIPGEPDERAEQPDGLVGLVDQLQRHRHARCHVPDRWRQQRRLVREPASPGNRAGGDQGIPGHQQQLQRRVRPRLRRGGARADEVGNESDPWRGGLYQAGQRLECAPGLRHRPTQQPAPELRWRRRFAAEERCALCVWQCRIRTSRRHEQLHARPDYRRGYIRTAAHARQRHASESRVPGFRYWRDSAA